MVGVSLLTLSILPTAPDTNTNVPQNWLLYFWQKALVNDSLHTTFQESPEEFSRIIKQHLQIKHTHIFLILTFPP